MSKARAYRNATIINGDATVEVIEKGTILVDEQGIISAIGKVEDVKIPAGCPVVDLTGKYVMPGLINAHVHLFMPGGPRKEMIGKKTERLLKLVNTPIGKLYVRKMYRDDAKTAVNAGITTVRDVGSINYEDLRLAEEINSGKRPGPRVICSGTLITPTGGHGCTIPGTLVVDGPWEFRKAVRENYHHQVDWIKICNTGGVSDAKFVGEAGMPHMTVEEIEAVCDEAHKRNLMVASHCESTQGIRDALAAGVDTIEHGADIEEDMVELFLNNPKTLRGYTCLIPTISAGSGLVEHADTFEDNEQNRIMLDNSEIIRQGCVDGLKKALKYGIKVGIGTDASVPFCTHYNTWRELVYFKKNSELSNKEILSIATKQTAEILDIDKITGTLDAGKAADFMVTSKNPLDDLRNIEKPVHVIARGEFIEQPKYKKITGCE